MEAEKAFGALPRRWRLIDQPLSVQFLVAGGVVAFFMLASLGILFFQADYQARVSAILEETNQTIAGLNTLGRDLYRQQTATIEFARSHDDRFSAKVREGRQLWDDGIPRIRKLLNDEPKQIEVLAHLQESYQTWLKFCDQLMSNTIQPDDGALRVESAMFKEAFLIIDQMISTQQREHEVRDRMEKRVVRTTFIVLAAMNLLLLMIFGLVLVRLYNSIARPIHDLSVGIQSYEDGDFATRVPVSNRSQIGFLEASFNELAEKIEAMVTDLRHLDVMKTEFISTVSHELRTPLTSIGGYVKLLVSGDAGPVTETQKEFLHIIDTNVVRLTHLINDILDVEKMESGKVQLVREPQNLSEVLRECRDTFDIVATQKGLKLKYDVPASLPTVMGDRSRMVQIFMNLISNAIKYTPGGYVEIAAEEKDYAVTVRIRDSGIGLTKEEQEKLFQKFYRTRSGLSSNEGGTGLGLVIVRGLVEAHGGRITVDSTPGQGTTFTITLPVNQPIIQVEDIHDVPVALPVEQKPGMPEPIVLAPAISEWTRQIWVLDASLADVEQMRGLIEHAGPLFRGYSLKVRSFSAVEEMPKITNAFEAPVMVIIDPKGTDLIPALRQRLHRTVPVLVVSAEIDTATAFSQGAAALLTKPIGEREFLIAVKDLISSKGWRILVADRNTDLRILIRRGLEQRGFKVDDVERGSHVLGRLEKEDYDLALIDMNFPDVSGVELLKAIRRGDRFKNLPVFVMLDQDRKLPSREELVSWGADQFVGKYRGIGGIVDAVTQYLEDKKLIEQHH